MPILELKDVRYSYSPEKVVLRGVNCVFECGTLYALVGKSGAGKSTLLSLMAGLDLPESGQVLFEGTPTGDMDLDEYRRRKAAVIYQDFALFPMLTALENIEYPMELCHVDAKEARQQALALARRVSLPEELLDRYPTHISGGEQQRVAIARGLTMDRRLLLADEPTGNLDSENSDNIIDLLLKLAHDENRCVIVVTHDLSVMDRADVVLMVIDATQGVTEQDAKIAGIAHDRGKGIIVVVNKWDAIEKTDKTIYEYTNKLKETLAYMPYAEYVFVSALTGQRMQKLFDLIDMVRENQTLRVATGVLNEIVTEAVAMQQPPSDKGKRLKIYYVTQVSVKPPTFVVFVNDKELMHFSYTRYLENKIREAFGFRGTSLKFIIRERKEKD